MPARSVCLVTLSLSDAGPGRFGRQVSVTDIYHAMPYHTMVGLFSSVQFSPGRFGGQVSVTDIYHTIPYHTSSVRWVFFLRLGQLADRFAFRVWCVG